MIIPPATPARPDVLTLIGPDYDRPSVQPANRTLIICAAPRTGSHELDRYLLAAGIGVPHEYFNPNYASRLGERWGFANNPLTPAELKRYIQALRCRRAQNGVFATKLQFPQFDRTLRNEHGRQLFEGATVVHLFRPDAAAQFTSYRSALETGIWDFSNHQTVPAVRRDSKDFVALFKQALQALDSLMGQDAGFRCVFALLGIRPIFITMDELFSDPHRTVRKIADALAVSIDHDGLNRAVEVSAPYDRDYAETIAGFRDQLREVVFRGFESPRARSGS